MARNFLFATFLFYCMETREVLEKAYFTLGNSLERQYKGSFNLKNHCYWRIANDNAVGNKWSNVVDRPFYKNCSIEQLNQSVDILMEMETKPENILHYNEISLHLRNKKNE